MEPRASMLGVLQRFFYRMHERGVPYCHWKSNEHLRDGLFGDTDLDLLVDRSYARELTEILAYTGFRRFAAASSAAYPAVEDYLGFDDETGSLVHLHVHHRLVLGEKHLKGYCLPWADLVLERRLEDPESGVYVSDPAVETVLLLVRSALKLRTRDRLREVRGRPIFGKGASREFEWLRERASAAQVMSVAASMVGDAAAEIIGRIVDQGPSFAVIRQLRRVVESVLQMSKMYPSIDARIRRPMRELSWLIAGVNARTLRRPLALRRVNPAGGAVIAFLGADGSGKSTMVREAARWLAWKLDVYTVYHGSGDGAASWMRRPLLTMRRLVRRGRRRSGTSHGHSDNAEDTRTDFRSRAKVVSVEGEDQGHSRSRRISPFLLVWALVLSWEKRGKLATSWRARHRGIVVVTDRYPQNQVDGFNDGPLLARWRAHAHPVLRAIATWEATPYRWADATPPDVVVKLHVDPDVAHARKAGDAMSREEVARRVRAVANLEFPADRVHVIDANRSPQEVLLDVKRVLWAKM